MHLTDEEIEGYANMLNGKTEDTRKIHQGIEHDLRGKIVESLRNYSERHGGGFSFTPTWVSQLVCAERVDVASVLTSLAIEQPDQLGLVTIVRPNGEPWVKFIYAPELYESEK